MSVTVRRDDNTIHVNDPDRKRIADLHAQLVKKMSKDDVDTLAELIALERKMKKT